VVVELEVEEQISGAEVNPSSVSKDLAFVRGVPLCAKRPLKV
jgi:hypothetical protein